MRTDETRLLADALTWAAAPPDRHVVVLDLSGVLHADDPLFRRTLSRWLTGAAAKGGGPAEGVAVYDLAHARVALAIDAAALDARRRALGHVAGVLAEHRRGAIKAGWYDLKTDAAAFATVARDLHALAEAGDVPAEPPVEEGLGRFLTLERGLHAVDLAPLVRQQQAFYITDDGTPEPVLLEVTVALAELERLFGQPLRGGDWLFGLVTEMLDRRMLYHLMRDPSEVALPVAVKLHAATVRDPDFGHLLAQFPARKHGKLVVELPFLEWQADPAAVQAAIDTARLHDLPVALDHVPFAALKAGGLPAVDYLRVPWVDDAGVRADLTGGRAAVEAVGRDRCVLARCVDAKALDDGIAAGFRILQGPAIAKLAAEHAKVAADRQREMVVGGELADMAAPHAGEAAGPRGGAFGWLSRIMGRKG